MQEVIRPPTMSITVPAVVSLPGGHSGRFAVRDNGKTPIHVTAQVGSYTVREFRFPASVHGKPWLTVTPRAFTVQPGHVTWVTVTSRPPAGATGTRFAGVAFRAAPVGGAAGHGSASAVSGAVATSVRIPLTGHVPARPLPPEFQPPGSSSHAVWLIVCAVAVLAAAGLAVAGARRWQRSRRRIADAEMSAQYPRYNHARNPARHRTP